MSTGDLLPPIDDNDEHDELDREGVILTELLDSVRLLHTKVDLVDKKLGNMGTRVGKLEEMTSRLSMYVGRGKGVDVTISTGVTPSQSGALTWTAWRHVIRSSIMLVVWTKLSVSHEWLVVKSFPFNDDFMLDMCRLVDQMIPA